MRCGSTSCGTRAAFTKLAPLRAMNCHCAQDPETAKLRMALGGAILAEKPNVKVWEKRGRNPRDATPLPAPRTS